MLGVQHGGLRTTPDVTDVVDVPKTYPANVSCPTCHTDNQKMLEWEEKRNREAAERAHNREKVGRTRSQ